MEFWSKLSPQYAAVENVSWRLGVGEKTCDEELIPTSWKDNGVTNHQSDESLSNVLAPADVCQRAKFTVSEEEITAVLQGMAYNS